MSAKVVVMVDAFDGTKHKISVRNFRAVVDGRKPVGIGFSPLLFAMLWYSKKTRKKLSVYPFVVEEEKLTLVRIKGRWAKKVSELFEVPVPEDLKGKFEFCGCEIFRRKKESLV